MKERDPEKYERFAYRRDLVENERDMTVPEIAAEFGVSAQAVREAAKKGWIPARKVGRDWIIKRSDAFIRWQK